MVLVFDPCMSVGPLFTLFDLDLMDIHGACMYINFTFLRINRTPRCFLECFGKRLYGLSNLERILPSNVLPRRDSRVPRCGDGVSRLF